MKRIISAAIIFLLAAVPFSRGQSYSFNGPQTGKLAGQDGWQWGESSLDAVVGFSAKYYDVPFGDVQIDAGGSRDVGRLAIGATASEPTGGTFSPQLNGYVGPYTSGNLGLAGAFRNFGPAASSTLGLMGNEILQFGADVHGGNVFVGLGRTVPGFFDNFDFAIQFALTNSGILIKNEGSTLGAASWDSLDPAYSPDHWFEMRLVVDLLANGGDGSGSLLFRDLTLGETQLAPVPGLQNLDLGLSTLGLLSTPADWDGLGIYLVNSNTDPGSRLGVDNIVMTVPEPSLGGVYVICLLFRCSGRDSRQNSAFPIDICPFGRLSRTHAA